MRACFDDQVLLRVKIGEVGGDLQVVRLESIDLLEHRDRLQSKLLIAIMISDAPETQYRGRVIANADLKVAENIQRRKIVRLVLDQLAVFLDGRRNLPHLEVSLGSTQSLFLIERHVLRSNGMNSGERSNALLSEEPELGAC